MISINPTVRFSPCAELSLQQTHFAATSAMKAFNQNDAAEVTASLKTLGEQALAERGGDPIAMKSLVFLAANGKELGEEACKTLETVCAKAFGSPPPEKIAMERIESAGAHALEAFRAIKPKAGDTKVAQDAAKLAVSVMPVYLLQIAGQHALQTKQMTLADEIGKALNDRLSPGQTQPHHWLTNRDAALEQLKEVTGKTYANMKPGLVVELPATPMTDADRDNKLFVGLVKGEQRPVSFKLGDEYVHGFVRLDGSGKQHICVLNSHTDKLDFMDNFMKLLGLPPSAGKSVALDLGRGGSGLSEASFAQWLFTYCSNNGGGTVENIEKFSKHVLKHRPALDFLQASRVSEQRRASATQDAQMSQASSSPLDLQLPKSPVNKKNDDAESNAQALVVPPQRKDMSADPEEVPKSSDHLDARNEGGEIVLDDIESQERKDPDVDDQTILDDEQEDEDSHQEMTENHVITKSVKLDGKQVESGCCL